MKPHCARRTDTAPHAEGCAAGRRHGLREGSAPLPAVLKTPRHGAARSTKVVIGLLLCLLAWVANGAGASPGLICTADDGARAIHFIAPAPHFSLEPHQSIHPQLGPGFTAEWTGLIRIPQRGRYLLHSDTPVWISRAEAQNQPLDLEPGDLPVRIKYIRRPGKARLQLWWESDQFPLEPIPASAFFHAHPPAEIAAAAELGQGRELFDSLGCVSCHASTNPLLKPRGAPDLSDAGRRLKPEWIFPWLENPSRFHAESAMPALLRSAQDRADVTAYLATLHGPAISPARIPQKNAEEGRRLFARIGCAACHTETALSLAGAGSKFKEGELFRYLRHPLHARPGTRNPDFSLTPEEAAALAAFLAERKEPVSEQEPPIGDAQRGRELAQANGCAACHAIKDDAGALGKSLAAPAFEALNASRGCLAPSVPAHAPDFRLSATERNALIQFVRQPDISEAPLVDLPRLVSRFRCASCHDFHGPASFVAGSAQHPPALTDAGNKLKADWLDRVLQHKQRVRPWLELRMPHYADDAAVPLARGFSAAAGANPAPAPTPSPALSQIRSGARLLGTADGGLSCINCHDCLGSKSTGEMRGPDLAQVHDRLRSDWIERWLRDPSRLAPGTAMPAFFSALPPAEAEEKISDITAALSAGRLMPPPPGLQGLAADYLLTVADAPILIRGFLPDSSARSIAVGLPGGLSYCFDAETCRLRYAWSGEFLNMTPTWHGRGASPPELRGTKFYVAPDLLPWRVGDKAALPALKFLGYALVNKVPEFRFTVNGVTVKQIVTSAPAGGLLARFELGERAQGAWFHAPEAGTVKSGGTALAADAEGWIKIPAGQPVVIEAHIPGPGGTGQGQAAL
jgi:mono/diheme cytochrome c family protein